MIKNKKIIVILLVTVIFFVLFVFLKNYKINQKSFSNTQEWDQDLYSKITNYDPFVGENIFSIEIPPPPKNTSRETKKEIEELKSLVSLRDSKMLVSIFNEMNFDSTSFGGVLYADLFKNRPKTKELFDMVMNEFDSLVMYQKELFNRVRPSILDSDLTTAIPVPGHPAYPSGHASQSWLVAHLLSILDEEKKDLYFESAYDIAWHREVAGVHYKSDSNAGRLLADKYMDLLKENEKFQILLQGARLEW